MQLARFARRRFCHLPTALEPLPRLVGRARRTAAPGQARRPDRARLRRQQDPQARVPARRGAGRGRRHAGHRRRRAVQPLPADRGGRRAPRPRLRAGAAARGCLEPSRLRARRQRAARSPGRRRSCTWSSAPPTSRPSCSGSRTTLRGAGRRPFVIPIGGSTPVGALGYVSAGLELLAQADGPGPAARRDRPRLGQRRHPGGPAGGGPRARRRRPGDRHQRERAHGRARGHGRRARPGAPPACSAPPAPPRASVEVAGRLRRRRLRPADRGHARGACACAPRSRACSSTRSTAARRWPA